MKYEWNSDKAAANLAKHGVAFEAIHGFDWDTALIARDIRDFGEVRMKALGLIERRVHFVAYTDRSGCRRIISLRKANPRETRRYMEESDG